MSLLSYGVIWHIPVYQAISRKQRSELENKYCMKVKD